MSPNSGTHVPGQGTRGGWPSVTGTENSYFCYQRGHHGWFQPQDFPVPSLTIPRIVLAAAQSASGPRLVVDSCPDPVFYALLQLPDSSSPPPPFCRHGGSLWVMMQPSLPGCWRLQVLQTDRHGCWTGTAAARTHWCPRDWTTPEWICLSPSVP